MKRILEGSYKNYMAYYLDGLDGQWHNAITSVLAPYSKIDR